MRLYSSLCISTLCLVISRAVAENLIQTGNVADAADKKIFWKRDTPQPKKPLAGTRVGQHVPASDLDSKETKTSDSSFNKSTNESSEPFIINIIKLDPNKLNVPVFKQGAIREAPTNDDTSQNENETSNGDVSTENVTNQSEDDKSSGAKWIGNEVETIDDDTESNDEDNLEPGSSGTDPTESQITTTLDDGFLFEDSTTMSNDSPAPKTMDDINDILLEYDVEVSQRCFHAQNARLRHLLSFYDRKHINEKVRSMAEMYRAKGRFWILLKFLDERNVTESLDPLSKAKIHQIVERVGFGSLPFIEVQELQVALSSLEDSYRKRYVVGYQQSKNSDLVYERGIEKKLSDTNKTYAELLYYWSEWHKATDNQSVENYAIYRHTINKAAKLQSLQDGSKLLQRPFGDPNLHKTIMRLWKEVKPLYEKLRLYALQKLKQLHGKNYKHTGDYIPAHLLGTLSGGNWQQLYRIVKPYPCQMDRENIVKDSAQYYCDESMKLGNSIIKDRPVVDCSSFILETDDSGYVDCHPLSYDMCDGKSYIMTTCDNEKVGMDFGREFEKMMYAMQFAQQPFVFRNPPHPGFMEAIALLFTSKTFNHVRDYGEASPESEMNQLLRESLYILPELAYAVSLEAFRWDITAGTLPKSSWNDQWWKLRREFEGIEPPLKKPLGDFDPAANYDIVMDIDHARRFLGIIMHFHMLKSFCHESWSSPTCKHAPIVTKYPQQPLHKCNLFGKTLIGDKISAITKRGSSIDWQEAWYNLTGSKEISANALLEYFQPINEYLDSQKSDNKVSYWVAIGIGIAILVLIIIFIIIFFWKRRNKGKADLKHDAEGSGYENNELGKVNAGMDAEETKP